MAFIIKQGDLLPPITATLTDEDKVAQNLTGYTMQIRFRRRGQTTTTTAAAIITDAANGEVSYSWISGDTDAAGLYDAEWVGDNGGDQQTWPTNEFFHFEVKTSL